MADQTIPYRPRFDTSRRKAHEPYVDEPAVDAEVRDRLLASRYSTVRAASKKLQSSLDVHNVRETYDHHAVDHAKSAVKTRYTPVKTGALGSLRSGQANFEGLGLNEWGRDQKKNVAVPEQLKDLVRKRGDALPAYEANTRIKPGAARGYTAAIQPQRANSRSLVTANTQLETKRENLTGNVIEDKIKKG